MSAMNNIVIEELVDQHFEEASFLWSQRDIAVTSPVYTLEDLAHLDERVEAHVDGLRVAGDYARTLCEAGIDEDEPGTFFVATIIAFESGDKSRINQLIELANSSHASFRAMVSGLGWMDNKRFNASIPGMVNAKSLALRRLGIAACGIRRINPRAFLDQAIDSPDLLLKVNALKAAGELKRVDLLTRVQSHLGHEDDACRFEATRTAILLGDRSAINVLSTFVLSLSSFTLPAMQLALRLTDGATARNWLMAQSKDPAQRHQMLLGTGMTGDPVFIPMLIKQMSQPELARAAADAFSMITGVKLAEDRLEGEWPEDFEASPNDNPADENVEMDADEDLPWPDSELVVKWWEQNKGNFTPGHRYLAGKPISAAHCTHVLTTGNQRQRLAAALEVALRQPDAKWFNARANAAWQMGDVACFN
jgi:uncharacterized protein (TIGR02270 family)